MAQKNESSTAFKIQQINAAEVELIQKMNDVDKLKLIDLMENNKTISKVNDLSIQLKNVLRVKKKFKDDQAKQQSLLNFSKTLVKAIRNEVKINILKQERQTGTIYMKFVAKKKLEILNRVLSNQGKTLVGGKRKKTRKYKKRKLRNPSKSRRKPRRSRRKR